VISIWWVKLLCSDPEEDGWLQVLTALRGEVLASSSSSSSMAHFTPEEVKSVRDIISPGMDWYKQQRKLGDVLAGLLHNRATGLKLADLRGRPFDRPIPSRVDFSGQVMLRAEAFVLGLLPEDFAFLEIPAAPEGGRRLSYLLEDGPETTQPRINAF
jgi:hypothetical protein